MAGVFGPNASAAFDRAADRARKVLVPGDRVTLGSICGVGRRTTVTFAHFSTPSGLPDPDGRCFSSKTVDDLSAWNIVAVNGQPISFRDEAGEAAVAADRAWIGAERVQKRRAGFRIVEGER